MESHYKIWIHRDYYLSLNDVCDVNWGCCKLSLIAFKMLKSGLIKVSHFLGIRDKNLYCKTNAFSVLFSASLIAI